MRLFLFLIGGTGSRVLRPLVMQLAAGILPTGDDGNAKALEVVPVIIDPHKANEDLKRTENLLRNYKQIRHALYGDSVDVRKGFFAAKISTLKDVAPNASALADTFLFNIDAIESKTFRDFISYNTLDSSNQALCSMMFSKYQLDTKMDIGFVGNPNIGSVALNKIKDSEEFRQFSNVFQKGDRVFIVSSIFGGTGAAGYPILVNNIRNAVNNSQVNNRGDVANAYIGALTVLPYFNVQQDDKSPISRADFISKTKSALYYYHDNLTGLRHEGTDLPLSKVNVCYYIGDEVPSTPYFNDPGNNGQRNDAHLVEFVGATAILDFLQTSDDRLKSELGRAVNPVFKEYGLADDKKAVSLKTLGASTRSMINRQSVKFHIAYMYMTNRFKEDIGRGYTLDKPEIGKNMMSTSFYTTLTSQFYVAYLQWLKEMKANQRSFVPFNLDTANPKDCITEVEAKTSFFHPAVSYNSILSALNNASQKAVKESLYNVGEEPKRLFGLLDTALDRLIDDKFSSVI